MATFSKFGPETTAEEVTSAFKASITGKTSSSNPLQLH